MVCWPNRAATHACTSRVTGTLPLLCLHGSPERLLPFHRDVSSGNGARCASRAWSIHLWPFTERVCQSLPGSVEGKVGQRAKRVSSHEALFSLFLKHGLNFVKSNDSTSLLISSSSPNSNKIREWRWAKFTHNSIKKKGCNQKTRSADKPLQDNSSAGRCVGQIRGRRRGGTCGLAGAGGRTAPPGGGPEGLAGTGAQVNRGGTSN